MPNPKRGEIWLVYPDPITVGAELEKERPAVVVSSDAISTRSKIWLIVPITGWHEKFLDNYWHVRIEPEKNNGLDKISTIDTLQLRCVDQKRFIKKKGFATANQMDEIVAAIAALIEYQ